jgi:hypothetical protein
VLPAITTLAAGLLATFVAGTAGLPLLLIAAAGLAIAALAKAIIDNWSQITSMATEVFNSAWGGIKQGAADLVQAVKNLITGPLDTLRSGFTGETAASSTQAEKNRKADEIKAQYDSGAITKDQYVKGTKEALNGFNGFNNSSIMQAISRENRQSPSGSGIVIANSSEAILNRQQQAQLLSSLGNKPSLSIGSIVINSQAKDAQQIAKDVVKYIQQEFDNYSQGYVNAPVS